MKDMSRIVLISILFFSFCTRTKAGNSTPVEKYPVKLIGDFSEHKPFIVYLTGDGGWNNFSEQLCDDLHKQGYSVVVFNSRKYFWNAVSPDQFINDLEGIINFYLKQSPVQSFGVVGYSFGADVGAFIPAMLSDELKEKLRPMVLMSPGLSTDFEVKLMDLLGAPEADRKYKILPELKQTSVPILCLFGNDEELRIKEYLKESEKITVEILPGGHRFDFDTKKLVTQIIDKIDPS